MSNVTRTDQSWLVSFNDPIAKMVCIVSYPAQGDALGQLLRDVGVPDVRWASGPTGSIVVSFPDESIAYVLKYFGEVEPLIGLGLEYDYRFETRLKHVARFFKKVPYATLDSTYRLGGRAKLNEILSKGTWR